MTSDITPADTPLAVIRRQFSLRASPKCTRNVSHTECAPVRC